MFRRTSSADCTHCEQRTWRLHCTRTHCGWYVCQTCGLTMDPVHGRSYRPGEQTDEKRRSA